MRDTRVILEAVALASALGLTFDLLIASPRPVPAGMVVIGGCFSAVGLLTVRSFGAPPVRRAVQDARSERVLVVGAGYTGQFVATALFAEGGSRGLPVGFLDDDPGKQRRCILGIPVLGAINTLAHAAESHAIDVIAIAIPNAEPKRLEAVIRTAHTTSARVCVLAPPTAPLSVPLVAGPQIDFDRLVGRASSREQTPTTEVGFIRDRVVLVTGAAGSIGSELVRKLAEFEPRTIVALDINETELVSLAEDVNRARQREVVHLQPASVTQGEDVYGVFCRYEPQVVFHAAALKHVPVLEMHPHQGVIVNVGGTLNVCTWARHFGCDRVVFISTDKAVLPESVLGYTKRIGELLIRAHQGTSGTGFCAVRFGNVIGSRGSALPGFLRQIDAGGPVTITHHEATRYFMSVVEAVNLVIEAGAEAGRWDTFILDMGEPVNVVDLAHRLIRERGLRVGKDIQVRFTGLRPGEKLTESLLFPFERLERTSNPHISRIEDLSRPDLSDFVVEVRALVDRVYTSSEDELRVSLQRLATCAGEEAAAATESRVNGSP